MQGDDGAAPIPTQEYIRRAVENQDGDDCDFSLNPWVCAVDFVRREGVHPLHHPPSPQFCVLVLTVSISSISKFGF